MKKSREVYENFQNVDKKIDLLFKNVLENVDIAHFIPMFSQKEIFINVTFSYSADE